MLERLRNTLTQLSDNQGLRKLSNCEFEGRMILDESGEWMVNLSSNDYLGIAGNSDLREEFFRSNYADEELGSGSSRLLAGNYKAHSIYELTLEKIFKNAALSFSSGYAMNIGILPALTTKNSVVIADKSIHASIIDGMGLCKCPTMRFRHNNLKHLEELIIKHLDVAEDIFIVVESVYSMDGDLCDLRALVELKKRYKKVILYVDEAHGVGVFGENSRGLAEMYNVENEIDIRCFTCGKALGGVGAFVVCDKVIKDYLINKCRSLIFNTSLPPINLAWNTFAVEKIAGMDYERTQLLKKAKFLREEIAKKGYKMPSQSHIIPIITGDNASATALAKRLQTNGIFVMPIRTPTVAAGSERVRISLTATVQQIDIEKIIDTI